ncbi:nitrogen regulation protein NR(II) [Acidipila sp. EB88]|uniref:two-component system sensor histidine kinase NtrB n=1 Tax=Acidipila sp. EB88 TaxID=2305226 RepID=UPI000F5FC1C4|nr:PAS domain-containing sensor histidine kinase [Acidipila sp. EB88]RRA49947.1 PAS domain-containing sensor histidine kinase [Acidipila sp. EB88]
MKLADTYASEPKTSNEKTGSAICIADLADRQHVVAASIQMGLSPTIVCPEPGASQKLNTFELIVADHAVAERLVAEFEGRESDGDGFSPAIIALLKRGDAQRSKDTLTDCNYDGILRFPMTPEETANHLAIVMYSHCASQRRYHAAWRELRLNRRIFRSVTAGISVANATLPDLPIIYVNPAFEAMTGYSREEVQGRNCRFLEGEERNQPALAIVRDALSSRRKGTAVLKNFRKDGTPFWNELSLSPIFDEEGKLTHYVGIQTDVTTRVELENALRETEKLAAVGRLASSIAHEINNPLSSVMNLIYIAERTECSQDTKKQLAQADKELRRVKLITEQSLRFSRQSTNAQATSSTEMLEPILDLYQSHARNARVVTSLQERPSRPLMCMESEIRQVLSHLVGNAIYAMQINGGLLIVRSREATGWKNGSHGILFTVADNGTGMNAETLRDMYKAFYTTKGIGGTGLGLWISSDIVERHHGKLKVRSSQRQGASGTVFQMFLPYRGIGSHPEVLAPSKLSPEIVYTY